MYPSGQNWWHWWRWMYQPGSHTKSSQLRPVDDSVFGTCAMWRYDVWHRRRQLSDRVLRKKCLCGSPDDTESSV